MKDSTSTNSQNAPNSEDARPPAGPQGHGFWPWQQFKNKRIAYMTLPLLVMATIVEFVILATGWKYQQVVCLPQGMGVTFFGIGPIGATILAVELLKLPLAIWTASRTGWTKGFMLIVGLPLICLLTFQLVKDMAVYEMTTAMLPASQMLEKASAEEIKIRQLNGELSAIETKKADRERKLAELTAKEAKAKADLDEALKRNEEARKEATTLTEYQKKEFSEVEARQAAIIKQFDADTAQLTKAITDLRARREAELARASQWNAEEARIENAYKAKMAEYTNKKAAYEKEKLEYYSASFVKRKLMREPIDPGVPPEREVNTNLKPTLVAELEAQIKAKETELSAVNAKRRERVAQVDADARRLREEFDRRSSTTRAETDRKRAESAAALAASAKEWKAEHEKIDQELAAAVQKVDGIRAELDASRKKAEGFYEAREAAIKNTQVHRIATTVEIVRGLLLGERPVSVTATAKERGDLLTDQISMVRIWVYPVLAFIVAFLPTLLVEIGFSTAVKAEPLRPAYRLGFLGRRLHWLETRAGRIKILRAERLAREASAQIEARDRAVATAKAAAEKARAEKEAEVAAARAEKEAEEQPARQTVTAAAAEQEEQLKKKEGEWAAKLSTMADSLNRAVVEKDALRDLQRAEIERQVQLRQNAWTDRLTQMRQELDDQRAASEAERKTLVEEQHKKLLELSEDYKTQINQARRQLADAELAAVEASAKLADDLKEALKARDAAELQLKHLTDSSAMQLSQAREDAARELEKVARLEKQRLERQQAEFEKTVRQREEDLEHRFKQREQELTIAFDARLVEEKTKLEQESRRREAELERHFEGRAREVDNRWKQSVQQREEAAQVRLQQREQQLQAQTEARLTDVQTQTERELRRRELEFERQLEAKSREADTRLSQELQQKELAFHAKLKQREQELAAKAAAREAQLQNQWEQNLRAREEAWEQQAQSRLRAAEARFAHEAQQKEDALQTKLREREQELQAQFNARQSELRTQWEREYQGRQQEWETQLITTRGAIEPLRSQLARIEKERDEAKQSATETARQMQDLRKKLTDASSLLASWKNGDSGGSHGSGSSHGAVLVVP